MLKGYRTYIADGLLVATSLQALVPQLHVLPDNISVALVGIFGALVLVFRFLAQVSE